jgi:hypothetical protein
VVHTKPADTAVLATYGPGAPEVTPLIAALGADLPSLMTALGAPASDTPLLWTAELVLGSHADGSTRHLYTALDAQCVGVDEHPQLYPAVADALIARVAAAASGTHAAAAATAAAAESAAVEVSVRLRRSRVHTRPYGCSKSSFLSERSSKFGRFLTVSRSSHHLSRSHRDQRRCG